MTADVARRAAELLEGVTELEPGELRPCPFCGGEAAREDIPEIDGAENAGGSCICCQRCGASSPLHFGRKENLFSSWNDRSPALLAERAALVEREQRLVAALEFYANPEVYKPHPHGPAFDDRDLSFVALRALLKGAPDV